jgi:hypothetical protein
LTRCKPGMSWWSLQTAQCRHPYWGQRQTQHAPRQPRLRSGGRCQQSCWCWRSRHGRSGKCGNVASKRRFNSLQPYGPIGGSSVARSRVRKLLDLRRSVPVNSPAYDEPQQSNSNAHVRDPNVGADSPKESSIHNYSPICSIWRFPAPTPKKTDTRHA